jgi:hypothetical protein
VRDAADEFGGARGIARVNRFDVITGMVRALEMMAKHEIGAHEG